MPPVLRRYTPPTCTLEIMAAGSVLSRWTERQVLKRVQFRLRLEDPRISREDRITLTGDRTQLEALCQAVSSYVQTVLVMAPSPAVTVMPIPAEPARSASIHLTARGILNHTLHLGELATPETGSTMALTVTQLADLATALDAYQADAIALPTLARSPSSGFRKQGIIAAATVLVFGTTLSLANLWLTASQTATQTEGSAEGSAESITERSEDAPIALGSRTAEQADSMDTPGEDTLSSAPSDRPTVEEDSSSPSDRPERLNRPAPTQPSPTPQDRPTRSTNSPPSVPSALNEPSETSLAMPAEPPIALDSAEPVRPQMPGPIEGERQSIPQSLPETALPPAPTAPPTDLAPGTAFDRIPQVAELRQYFQQRWAPPPDLNQALEYQLTIDASGAVQTVTPLGQPSRDYSGSALPSSGQTVVSPTTGESLRIRVLLHPEGSVQTFLESTNP
jgi:hypothetical protein